MSCVGLEPTTLSHASCTEATALTARLTVQSNIFENYTWVGFKVFKLCSYKHGKFITLNSLLVIFKTEFTKCLLSFNYKFQPTIDAAITYIFNSRQNMSTDVAWYILV